MPPLTRLSLISQDTARHVFTTAIIHSRAATSTRKLCMPFNLPVPGGRLRHLADRGAVVVVRWHDVARRTCAGLRGAARAVVVVHEHLVQGVEGLDAINSKETSRH